MTVFKREPLQVQELTERLLKFELNQVNAVTIKDTSVVKESDIKKPTRQNKMAVGKAQQRFRGSSPGPDVAHQE